MNEFFLTPCLRQEQKFNSLKKSLSTRFIPPNDEKIAESLFLSHP